MARDRRRLSAACLVLGLQAPGSRRGPRQQSVRHVKYENSQDQFAVRVALAVQDIAKPALVRPAHRSLEVGMRLHHGFDSSEDSGRLGPPVEDQDRCLAIPPGRVPVGLFTFSKAQIEPGLIARP